jgi:DNA-binding NarL/FixJ family response regulator
MAKESVQGSDELERQPRVWIVEDNSDYRQSLMRVVSTVAAPNSVRSFGKCEDALAALKRDTAPDVMFLDLGLPGISGIDGLAQFKSVAPGMRIVVLTSFDDPQRIFQAICGGASGYLLKSADVDRITSAIREAQAGGAPMSPTVANAVLNRFTELAAVRPPVHDYGLTAREKETLVGMVDGLTIKEIAWKLELSYHTVDGYVRNIYAKLHVSSRAGAVAKSLREQLF